MKRFCVMCCIFVCVAGALAAQISRGGTLYAAVKTVKLKSSTWFFASTKGSLPYGEQVTVTQVKGKWVEVRSSARPALSGWTAAANLSAKRVVVAGNTSAASASEVGLAGKGFNQEVENAYKAQGALNYADVDKTEAAIVSDGDLLQFLEEGHLTQGDRE